MKYFGPTVTSLFGIALIDRQARYRIAISQTKKAVGIKILTLVPSRRWSALSDLLPKSKKGEGIFTARNLMKTTLAR